MQTETGTNQTLYGYLQKLGAGRQSGTLVLRSANRDLTLSFQAGKIVAITERGVDAAQAVAVRLVDAGCVVEQVLDLVRQAQVNIEQLGKILISKEYVKPEEFERASKTFELNSLYRLRSPDTWEMQFEPGGSAQARPGGVAMTPAQLLLDLVELETDEARFNEVFGGLLTENQSVFRTGQVPVDLSHDESVIWEMIGPEGCAPIDITEMSLLSDYSIIVGLLSLLDQSAIEVRSSSEEAIPPVTEPESPAEDYEEDVWGDEATSAFADELVEPVDPRKQRPAKAAAHQAQSDVVAHIASRRDGKAAENQPADEFPPEFEPDGNKWSESRGGHRRSLFLRTLNYRMLEPAVLQRAVMVVIIAYLAGIALTAPQIFEAWFKALNEFSSGV